ncbi:MAG: low molecular weight protein arginine phosphatase [Clostridiaceae bacterium]|nr:low molecular weight protein arginine phosphatase [Clostridiaceae bacterium]
MKQILFVCTGNTCRSPMAAALFNRLAARELQGRGYEAVSAGLSAMDGAPASKNAMRAMDSYPDADLSHHRSRQLMHDDVKNAFLVLAMCRSHKQHILSMYPEAYQKVYTLKEYSYGAQADINDPFGGDESVYRQSAEEIARAVEKLVEKLKII